MERIIFSRESEKVVGIDRIPSPFEFEVKTPYSLAFTKQIVSGTYDLQKRNEKGEPLYMTNIQVDEDGELVSFDETTDPIDVLEEVDGVPVKTQERYPVTIPVPVYAPRSFPTDFMDFTYEDVLAAKKQSITENNLLKVVFYEEGMEEEHFSTDLSAHEADMGFGFIAVHPGGKVRTVKLPLDGKTNRLELYMEAQEGITAEIGSSASTFLPVDKGVVKFDSDVSEVYVRFTNTAETKREIHAFALLA